MTCEHCGSPLLSIAGEDKCGRCDTPRAQGRRERELEPIPPSKPDVRQEQRDAEDRSIHTAKLAAAKTFEEIDALVDNVKAQRLAGQLHDSAKTARYLATVGDILVRNSLLLDGRPTSIHESRDAEDTWSQIAKQLGYQDSTAEEIPEATQVAETALKQGTERR